MKNRFYSLPVKAAAIVLTVVLGVFTVLSCGAIGVMYAEEYYVRGVESLCNDAYREILSDYNWKAFEYVVNLSAPQKAEELSPNYSVTIKDAAGVLIYSNEGSEEAVCLSYDTVCWQYLMDGKVEEYTVTGALREGFSEGETDAFSVAKKTVEFFYAMRFWLIALAFFGLLAVVGLIVFLFCSAGNHPGEEQPRLNPMDHLPFDVVSFLLVALVALEWNTMNSLSGKELPFFGTLFALVDVLLLLWYLLSFASRMKVGCFWRTTFAGYLVRWLAKGAVVLGRFLAEIPLVWRTCALVAGVSVTELVFLLAVWEKETLMILWLMEKLILVPLVVYAAIALRRLQKGGERIARGGLGERVDTAYLLADFKRFGDTLNSIDEGMNRAVEERTKSERFKTELITNVSHDIKTPLTSIVNYVDLIKKEEPENEAVRDYLEVLDRQSARLKKLIEDLVEASKASSGSLTVAPERCDLGVLLTQVMGEYDARLRQAELEPLLRMPQQTVQIDADPRHLWRILDNLMANILKYAQPQTRVYLDLTADEREATVLFRNISKACLNLEGEELTERFVRGDSSRNTEGSGLGLSIARSLTELQGGAMKIDVDGDLFKVTLRFPLPDNEKNGSEE